MGICIKMYTLNVQLFAKVYLQKVEKKLKNESLRKNPNCSANQPFSDFVCFYFHLNW